MLPQSVTTTSPSRKNWHQELPVIPKHGCVPCPFTGAVETIKTQDDSSFFSVICRHCEMCCNREMFFLQLFHPFTCVTLPLGAKWNVECSFVLCWVMLCAIRYPSISSFIQVLLEEIPNVKVDSRSRELTTGQILHKRHIITWVHMAGVSFVTSTHYDIRHFDL